ncbi:DUF452 family protein [Defluviimonas sp. D31]|uniref:pimeloyl-ACP methyl esterase BioG family protein n=1 Tax=Defluviimonas sp. D31 TaxID=3083253 RepID=UPI00296F405D|nr:pimeloyl-ACP methyl esterase BioG family protein [Defluviimonas sp. D31]MDW4549096.1 DUF452 family protein [Defluviimonas sp. D31]
MEAIWLRRDGAARVVVFFAGWGAEPSDIAGLGGAYDVLFVRDWRALGDLPDLSSYTERLLVAWSFGVAAYGHWQAGRADPFTRKVAVNGTLAPVDRERGIPPRVFAMTLAGLSEENFHAFLARSHGADQPRRTVDVAALTAELEAVRDRGPAPETLFDRIWISEADGIIPPANQRRAWEGQADRITGIDAAHAPFAHWSDWEALS